MVAALFGSRFREACVCLCGMVGFVGSGVVVSRRSGRCICSVRVGTSLRSFSVEREWDEGLLDVCESIKEGLYVLSNRVRVAGLNRMLGSAGGTTNASGDDQKQLDVLSNEVMVSVLEGCRYVSVLASEEEENAVVKVDRPKEGGYVVVFDPLDGSSNIEACIPTGTIFGVYRATQGGKASDVLQTGRNLVLGGYCLYSSTTVLVLSDGNGTHAFCLDPERGDFVLKTPNMRIPESGSSYSVNDGRYHDWPEGLQQYIDDIKTGNGSQHRQYDTRYICSLVADVHYVLIRGGIAMNPRAHLRLVYEGNPIAFVVENAGGKASTGVGDIMDVKPEKLHHRLPLFVGSPLDVEELESYDSKGGVRQLVNPGYKY